MTTLKNHPYLLSVIGLYLNELVLGISMIAVSVNIKPIMEQLHTNPAGIGLMMSAVGIGKLITIIFAGPLSDKFGRKPFVVTGIIMYIIFYAGLPLCTNMTMAMLIFVICGLANSFLDAGTYPALMEAFPNSQATANVFVKAFISIGTFLFPLIVGIVSANHLSWGTSLYAIAVFAVISMLFTMKGVFPALSSKKNGASSESTVQFKSQPNFMIEGLCLLAIAFTCSTTFMTITNWLPLYAQNNVHMSQAAANGLISTYSIGSFAGVILTGILTKRFVKTPTLLFAYPVLSAITLFFMWASPSSTGLIIGAFIIGAFAAGGMVQLTISALSEFFPTGKGRNTMLCNVMVSVTVFGGNALTGFLAAKNVANVMLYDLIITALGALLAVIVLIRHHKVFITKQTTTEKAA